MSEGRGRWHAIAASRRPLRPARRSRVLGTSTLVAVALFALCGTALAFAFSGSIAQHPSLPSVLQVSRLSDRSQRSAPLSPGRTVPSGTVPSGTVAPGTVGPSLPVTAPAVLVPPTSGPAAQAITATAPAQAPGEGANSGTTTVVHPAPAVRVEDGSQPLTSGQDSSGGSGGGSGDN